MDTEIAKKELTPLKAIRAFCRRCVGIGVGGSYRDIDNCRSRPNAPPPSFRCPLWPWRSGHRRKRGHNRVLAEIRKVCLECKGGDSDLVAGCRAKDCPLWLYRFGNNPKRKGAGTPAPNQEGLRKLREERLRAARR